MINARCSPIFQRLLGPGETLEIVCEEPLRGRYVSVIIPTNYGILNFCEVEVYGKKGKINWESMVHYSIIWYRCNWYCVDGMVWYGIV